MDHITHHKRELIFLISFLLLFGIFFLLAMLNLRRHIPTFGIGIDYQTENWIVMILSFLAVIKVVVLIIKYEHEL